MAAHVAGKEEVLVRAALLLKQIEDWRGFLRGEEAKDVLRALRRHGRTELPPGLPASPAETRPQPKGEG